MTTPEIKEAITERTFHGMDLGETTPYFLIDPDKLSAFLMEQEKRIDKLYACRVCGFNHPNNDYCPNLSNTGACLSEWCKSNGHNVCLMGKPTPITGVCSVPGHEHYQGCGGGMVSPTPSVSGEEWQPEEEQEYWYIDESGFDYSYWNDMECDHNRRNFLGIYRTRQEAEDMAKQISEFVKSKRK